MTTSQCEHLHLLPCNICRPQTFERGNTQISKKFHYPKFEKSWGFMGSLDHLSSGGILFINCLLNVTKNFTWKRVSQLIYLIKSFSFNRWPWRSTIIRRHFLLLLLLFCFQKDIIKSCHWLHKLLNSEFSNSSGSRISQKGRHPERGRQPIWPKTAVKMKKIRPGGRPKS